LRPFVFVRDAFLLSLFCLILLAWKDYISWWWVAGLIAAYLLILVLAAINIRWNFFIPSMHHGARNSNNIALSFDDGPAAHTAEILDILSKEGVPAAFFCIGKNAEASPDIVRRWHSEGHLIGNHSFDHSFHFDWKGRKEMLEEINRTNETIVKVAGVKPRLFRPPYGVTNPELSHAVVLSNMTSVGWSLRSFDTKATDPEKLLHRITGNIKGGDIVLLHDSMQITARILTALIQSCREKGFTFVRLDKLLETDAYT
jgi:peptidoglycan/xylan/chitin deacetylase (PgdA/CDA1 family)